MSGSCAQHLQRRSGIFHLRIRVPDDLRSLVGLAEVRRSLHTYQISRARILAAVCAARVFEVFAVLRLKELSKDQVRGLICNLFEVMKREVEGAADHRLSDWERNEQLYCSSEVSAGVLTQRTMGAYDHEVKLTATRALAPMKLRMCDLAETTRDDLLDGAARAVVERERLYQFRLADRIAPFVPNDPIFAERAVAAPQSVIEVLGPTLGEAIDTYFATKQRSWTRKTHVIRSRYLGYLRQHFGHDRPLASIVAADVRGYRDAIARLRKNSGKAVCQTFAEKQTESGTHRIGDSTVALVFVPTQAFFRWCLSEQGYIESNPAENIRVAVAKRPKGKVSRRPFTADELIQLFAAPVFNGCLSAKRRFMTGSAIVQDAYYWVPIIGYYTGARLGEIVQLHLADVDSEDGISFLKITEEGGDGNHPDVKHVKSEAGVRKIPLHPDLIALGFLGFVEKRRRLQRKGSKRLFPEVKFGADGQASTVFSKWFGRLMSKAGLHDPALVFHSFRHNAEDAFRDALQPQYVIDRIIGHSDGATSASYGEGASLATLNAAVTAMRLKIRLPINAGEVDA
jgi:integrase